MPSAENSVVSSADSFYFIISFFGKVWLSLSAGAGSEIKDSHEGMQWDKRVNSLVCQTIENACG